MINGKWPVSIDESTSIVKSWYQMTQMIYAFGSHCWNQGLKYTWAAHVLSFEYWGRLKDNISTLNRLKKVRLKRRLRLGLPHLVQFYLSLNWIIRRQEKLKIYLAVGYDNLPGSRLGTSPSARIMAHDEL